MWWKLLSIELIILIFITHPISVCSLFIQPILHLFDHLDIGKEYTENRFEFNRKAAAFVKEYGLPRE